MFKPSIHRVFGGLLFSLLLANLIQIFVMPLPIHLCPLGPCYHLRFILVLLWFLYFVVGYILYCCVLGLSRKAGGHLKKRRKKRKRS